MDDELYCIMVQRRATAHLIRCTYDDFALALLDFGNNAAGTLYRAIKQNFGGNNGY